MSNNSHQRTMFEKNINGIKYHLEKNTLTAKVVKDKGYEGDIIIPETVVLDKVSYRVTSIGEDAFNGCKSLSSITIPNSVTSIGNEAFSCTSLASIVIPDSVTSIGERIFLGTSLTSIVVTKDNEVYDSRENCNAIIETSTNKLICGCQNTIIPNSVTSIGESAFCNCPSLISITIPDSVTSIGRGAFYECFSLTSIVIPDSVTSIGAKAFSSALIVVAEGNAVYDSRENCNAIIETSTNKLICGCQNTIIPSSVTSIGESAFLCTDVTSITIPDSVTSIGERAFLLCSSLSSITIPNSIMSIGDRAFYGCTRLRTISYNGTITQWKKITLGFLWDKLAPTNTVHCTDGNVKISGFIASIKNKFTI